MSESKHLSSSFLPVDPTSDFPLQNLPYGVFCPPGKTWGRVGVAIGEWIVDLSVLEEVGLLVVSEASGPIFDQPRLNPLMALGRKAWTSVRNQLTQLLAVDEPRLKDDRALREIALHPQAECRMLLPVDIGDYTDFYSSRYHATNVGTMLRGAEHALQENWLHLPVAYHGRASSVVASGTDIRRPRGQTGPEKFGPCRALDFELETGFFVGPGNPLGSPLPIEQAADNIFGLVLVNDWSARDLQKWEYVPLGPFLAKNFATSISPWVVTLDALAPFRRPGPEQSPTPLPYLQTAEPWSLDIELEVKLTLAGSQSPVNIVRSNVKHLYWSIAQQLAHHAVNGCNLRPGDLLASGTISGPEKSSRGCLLEMTWGGKEPLELPGGERRTFLEDGDRLTITGWCQGDGYRIGFGAVTGQVLPAE
jgi:fumarylacetoacetase